MGAGKRGLAADVLTALPYGVAVIDGHGRATGWNDAAERLVPALGSATGPRRCESLFSCTAEGGPCEEGCLALRAAGGSEALPEVRVDAAAEGATEALWITAAPGPQAGQAILHLRPGQVGDRRRRTMPHWLRSPQLHIRTLGSTRIDAPGASLGGEWLHQRPGQVLKFLLCERHRIVYADEIAEALWPESGRHGLGNVRYSVFQLRRQLEPARRRRERSSFIIATSGGYRIDRQLLRVDADDFEAALQAGAAAERRGDVMGADAAIERALALYTGDFLADELYAWWAVAERDRLHGLAIGALRRLVARATEAGDLDAAARLLERYAALEPLDPGVHRQLFEVWLALGRSNEASRRYAALRARLRRDLAEEPGFTLADLQPPAGVSRPG